MHQVVVRIIDPKISVFQFIAGSIENGEFVPFKDVADCVRSHLYGEALNIVRTDDLFGGIPYMPASAFSAVGFCLFATCDKVELFPGYLVFSYDYEYGTQKEDTKE